MEMFIKKHFKGAGSSLQLFVLSLGMRLRQALAYALLPFKKPGRISKTTSTVFIKGEPAVQKKWKQKLTGNNIPVSENENTGEEIIFCEGPYLSWKMIIAEITKNPGRLMYYFHGSDTHSAVSSYSSRNEGEVIEL